MKRSFFKGERVSYYGRGAGTVVADADQDRDESVRVLLDDGKEETVPLALSAALRRLDKAPRWVVYVGGTRHSDLTERDARRLYEERTRQGYPCTLQREGD